MVIVHRMLVLCMTMVRTLITKVMIGSPFRASSALVVDHSWRSEPSLEMLLLLIGVQRRILLMPAMLAAMTLHGQSLLVGHARVVCGARVGPARRGWTSLMLVHFRTLLQVRKCRPSWRNIVRVLRHAYVWSVWTVADSESALRSPWVLLLRNLMLREISRIVAKCCTTVPCCHQTIVKKEFVRLRDSNSLVGDW